MILLYEQTFVMIKPDAVSRGIIGNIVSQFENKGLKISAMKMLHVDEDLASQHYVEHTGKKFYKFLIDFIISNPCVAMIIEGNNVIEVTRTLVGDTNPQEASPSTIRGTFGMDVSRNIVHASDSPASAEREIALFFDPEEIMSYRKADEQWMYEK